MSWLLRTKDEIRSTDGGLPPWTIYQARCDWCPNRATYLVDAAAEPRVEGNTILLGYLHVEWEQTGPWALEGVALTRRGAHRKLRRRNSSNITKGIVLPPSTEPGHNTN